MSKSTEVASALIADYENDTIRSKIDAAKGDKWKDPNAFWVKYLTNQMHIGSNSVVLSKRMSSTGFIEVSKFNSFSKLSKDQQSEILMGFIPGGKNCRKEIKIARIISVCEKINSSGGIKRTFGNILSKVDLIKVLTSFDGVGAKVARNIPMDLYHPSFRNGSIPIDTNWIKIGKYLEFNWTNSEKHEQDIIDWRNKYIGREVIKDDWDFDRLVYWSLNSVQSNLRNVIP